MLGCQSFFHFSAVALNNPSQSAHTTQFPPGMFNQCDAEESSSTCLLHSSATDGIAGTIYPHRYLSPDSFPLYAALLPLQTRFFHNDLLLMIFAFVVQYDSELEM